MKVSKATLIGFAILIPVGALIAININSNDSSNSSSTVEASQKKQRVRTSRSRQKTHTKQHISSVASRRPRSESDSAVAVDPATLLAEREAAIEKMDDASTSYDPAQLPIIQPYLESSDPKLREAAIDAMINLGDAAAAPMLRDAAAKLKSDLEAKKMNEAADYLELPSANFKEISEMFKKRREQRAKEAESE